MQTFQLIRAAQVIQFEILRGYELMQLSQKFFDQPVRFGQYLIAHLLFAQSRRWCTQLQIAFLRQVHLILKSPPLLHHPYQIAPLDNH